MHVALKGEKLDAHTIKLAPVDEKRTYFNYILPVNQSIEITVFARCFNK